MTPGGKNKNMSPPLLSIRNLCVSFQGDESTNEVLHDVSFDLQEGDILGIVGESGSGKSVTSLAIMGLLPIPAGKITSGSIQFNGSELVRDTSEHYYKLRGNRISMIFQEPVSALNPVQRIEIQLAEVFKIHFPEKTKAEIRAESIQLLKDVGLMEPERRMKEYPHLLSGGICQRIMIAMSLACRPDILIADEPTTALDVTTQKQILDLLKKLQPKFGMTIIFITHDLGVVSQLCNRVVVMEQGYVREFNDVRKLFDNPQHSYTKALLRSIIHLETPPIAQLNPNLLIDESRRDEKGQKVLLTVKNLVKKYPIRSGVLGRVKSWHSAVNDVSFEIFEGEILGLVGESGCGKSTLGRAILRLEIPNSGDVIYNSQNLSSLNRTAMRKLRSEIQVIFQDTNESLNSRHTIGTILEEPFIIHKIGTSAERKEWVLDLLEKVQLPQDSVNRFPHEFSGGQRQRIGIARAIALNPKIIICDEPVSALDVTTQKEVLDLLCELKNKLDMSLLFISHDLAVVKHISNRVMVMKEGEIVESNTVDEIYNNPQHSYTRLLIDSIPRT